MAVVASRWSWLLAGVGLGGALLAGLYRPPLAWWAAWAAGRQGVPAGLLLATIHAETRGLATARRVEATARQLAAPGGDACDRARWLGARRFPRDGLAGSLLAQEVIGGWSRGVAGLDGLGMPYRAPGEGGCQVTLPGDDEGERVGAPFARYFRATARGTRPAGQVNAVVLHVTNGTFASAVSWFRRPGARTSAHYVIRASDGLVVQMVDEREAAFHDACFNDATIGVEHEGFTAEGGRWFSDEMYRASARLVRDIATRHRIPLDSQHIMGHSDAPDCSEHDDPGAAWAWGLYWRLLRGEDDARGG